MEDTIFRLESLPVAALVKLPLFDQVCHRHSCRKSLVNFPTCPCCVFI